MQMRMLRNLYQFTVNWIFCLLIVGALLGSLVHLQNILVASRGAIVLCLVLGILVALLSYFYHKVDVLEIVERVKLKKYLLIVMIFITVTWQLLMVLSLSGDSWWDPQILSRVASNNNVEKYMLVYFSTYPNNVFLLWMERIIWRSMVFFNILNYSIYIKVLAIISFALVDCSIWLLAKAMVHRYSSTTVYVTLAIEWILLALTPFAVIAYSDIPALFINTILVFLIMRLERLDMGGQRKIILVLGMTFAIAYFIKPTTIIFAIALLINAFLGISKRNYWHTLVLFVVGVIGFGMIYGSIHHMQNHNGIVSIKKSAAMPMNHFIAMGMIGDGGYNQADVTASQNIASLQKRKAYNWQVIRQRFQNYGLANYLKFLAKKHVANTNDGTFAWGYDGHEGFLVVKRNSNSNKLIKFVRWIFMDYNSPLKSYVVNANWHGGKVIVQITWIILLAMLFGVSLVRNPEVDVYKLTLIGAMAFLLIFEGGRSRYMVQFLPYFMIIAANFNAKDAIKNVRGLTKWKKGDC